MNTTLRIVAKGMYAGLTFAETWVYMSPGDILQIWLYRLEANG